MPAQRLWITGDAEVRERLQQFQRSDLPDLHQEPAMPATIAAPATGQITVVPDGLRQAAATVRAVAALLAEVRGRLAALVMDLLLVVGGPRAAPALAELWTRWSACLGDLASAGADTASLLEAAATTYETTDAASMPVPTPNGGP